MNATTKYLLSICVLGGGTGCSLFTYNQLTKKGEGDAFGDSLEKYREDSLEDLKTIVIQKDTPKEEAIEKIKSYCEDNKGKNFDHHKLLTFSKFCKFKFYKVKDLLITNGVKNFANTNEDYEISLFLLKNIKRSEVESLKTVSNIDDLKNGCNRTLNSSASKTNPKEIPEANILCKASLMRTIEDYIKLGLEETNINVAEERLLENSESIFKKTDVINSKLKEKNLQIPDFSKETTGGGKKAKEWCELELKKKLNGTLTVPYIEVVLKACQAKTESEILNILQTKYGYSS